MDIRESSIKTAVVEGPLHDSTIQSIDHLSSSDLYSSAPWSILSQHAEQMTVSTAVAEGFGRPLGVMSHYRMQRLPASYEFGTAIDTQPPEWRRCRRSLLGSRVGNRYVPTIDSKLTALDGERVIASILDALLGSRPRMLELSAMMYLPTEAAQHVVAAAALVGLPALAVLGDTEAIIELQESSSLEEFMRGLNRRRAEDCRRERRQFFSSGLLLDEYRLSDQLDTVAELCVQNKAKYGSSIRVDSVRSFLGAQAAVLDDQSVVFMATRGGLPVASSLHYVYNNSLYARIFGMDYTRGGDASEYFELLFNRPIEYALEHGFDRYFLGTGALEAKARRGAVLHPLWHIIFPSDGLLIDVASAHRASQERLAEWRKRLRGIGQEVWDEWHLID